MGILFWKSIDHIIVITLWVLFTIVQIILHLDLRFYSDISFNSRSYAFCLIQNCKTVYYEHLHSKFSAYSIKKKTSCHVSIHVILDIACHEFEWFVTMPLLHHFIITLPIFEEKVSKDNEQIIISQPIIFTT